LGPPLFCQEVPMPTIATIGSIQIRIYYDDHGVPHFHAVSPDFDFKIAIADFSVISGTGRIRGVTLPRSAHGGNSIAMRYC